jgi:hypothetical protein
MFISELDIHEKLLATTLNMSLIPTLRSLVLEFLPVIRIVVFRLFHLKERLEHTLVVEQFFTHKTVTLRNGGTRVLWVKKPKDVTKFVQEFIRDYREVAEGNTRVHTILSGCPDEELPRWHLIKTEDVHRVLDSPRAWFADEPALEPIIYRPIVIIAPGLKIGRSSGGYWTVCHNRRVHRNLHFRRAAVIVESILRKKRAYVWSFSYNGDFATEIEGATTQILKGMADNVDSYIGFDYPDVFEA